jgi:biopolymer transport protein ExbD
MRFPRNTKVFRGQLDAAPYAGVFFLLAMFLLLNSSFVFIPGIEIHLPEAANLSGTANPTVAVAVDTSNRIYFENQVTDEETLRERLRNAVAAMPELTLVIQADQNTSWHIVNRLMLVARDAGLKNALTATRPPALPAPRSPGTP